jgi:hypothetical protein
VPGHFANLAEGSAQSHRVLDFFWCLAVYLVSSHFVSASESPATNYALSAHTVHFISLMEKFQEDPGLSIGISKLGVFLNEPRDLRLFPSCVMPRRKMPNP